MALMTQLAKLRDSFDKHSYTLIASMSLSKWKSPSKWNLLIPRELRGLTETVFSSLLTMCLSIPFPHVLKSSRWRVKGGAQLIEPICTCSESFASASKDAISLILQSLASKCSGRCSNQGRIQHFLKVGAEQEYYSARVSAPQ